MILVIWASPNNDGLTASAKDMFVSGIQKTAAEVDVVNLNMHHIEHCHVCIDGWGACRSAGKCVIPDDFQSIYKKMTEASGIAIITPVYWHDLAEPLKAFLDRVRRCETKHNHDLREKPCVLIACAGGSGRGVTQCLCKLEEILSHMEMNTMDRLPIVQFNRAYLLPALACAGESFSKKLLDHLRSVRKTVIQQK